MPLQGGEVNMGWRWSGLHAFMRGLAFCFLAQQKTGTFSEQFVRRLAAAAARVDSDSFLDRLVVDVLLRDVKVK